jgi:retinol dehydrogenase-12
MNGKVCIITGATSGVGLETAKALAEKGATVAVLGRSAERGARAMGEIRAVAKHPEEISFVLCDLASLDAVRKAGAEIAKRFEHIDVLINNAGLVIGKRRETVDGFEETFAVNHLAHFLLTGLLLENLQRAEQGRIINVASAAHWRGHIDLDDLQAERKYAGFTVYSNSKLANILFTRELAKRLAGSTVTVNAAHPGFVASNFGKANGWLANLLLLVSKPLQISSQKGAETSVYLASAPEVAGITGGYFDKSRQARSSKASNDPTLMRGLWDASEQMTDYPYRGLLPASIAAS